MASLMQEAHLSSAGKRLDMRHYIEGDASSAPGIGKPSHNNGMFALALPRLIHLHSYVSERRVGTILVGQKTPFRKSHKNAVHAVVALKTQ